MTLIGDGGCGDFWLDWYNLTDSQTVQNIAFVNREVYDLCRSYTTEVRSILANNLLLNVVVGSSNRARLAHVYSIMVHRSAR